MPRRETWAAAGLLVWEALLDQAANFFELIGTGSDTPLKKGRLSRRQHGAGYFHPPKGDFVIYPMP